VVREARGPVLGREDLERGRGLRGRLAAEVLHVFLEVRERGGVGVIREERGGPLDRREARDVARVERRQRARAIEVRDHLGAAHRDPAHDLLEAHVRVPELVTLFAHELELVRGIDHLVEAAVLAQERERRLMAAPPVREERRRPPREVRERGRVRRELPGVLTGLLEIRQRLRLRIVAFPCGRR